MKRAMILVLVIWGVVAGGCLSRNKQVAASSGAVKLSTTYRVAESAEFQVITILATENLVTFQVPILESQLIKEGLNNPDWQIFASYAWIQGSIWNLVAQENYALDSKTIERNGQKYVQATKSFPDLGIGWFWVRVWGRDLNSGNWLWINQRSQFCRNDTQDNPGYEFLINPGAGKVIHVPCVYQTRR